MASFASDRQTGLPLLVPFVGEATGGGAFPAGLEIVGALVSVVAITCESMIEDCDDVTPAMSN